MANELPYLPTYKNVGLLFEKIRTAKIPESFTTRYLSHTLGLKSAGDRPLITLLKTLGILENSGKPTARYSTLKNEKIAGRAIAEGIREAYAPLFEANESADRLERTDLSGLVAQVTGADGSVVSKIVGTFLALRTVADFSGEIVAKDKKENKLPEPPSQAPELHKSTVGQLRPEFHYNIQIHLPSNGTEQTYIDIFNALRKVFQ